MNVFFLMNDVLLISIACSGFEGLDMLVAMT